ncbi:ATP-grasp domain-containing protein [Clostridium algidicarnis]|uniref:Biotin carboxylase n=1 Tax=Clostridium algidicarnis DSM 15099 TaxID=1121295 RepID=A0A2S6FV61_9CLOT|nr:ATP-grasp domain-containing protein [Clostridium algidicarnis]PPK45273.1 biotin carboxylase [Clostridium algidicarnis DSM 15099]
MKQQKLMILGVSELQLPAILKAKEKGLYVIGVDMNKNAVGVKYVDEFYELSTIDTGGILDKAVELGIDGIMTLATDMPMRSVAAVGERLNLTTITQKTAIMATDKARMREQLSNCNVPIPFFSSVLTYEEFEKAVNSFHGDIIIKPSDSSGSRGVYLLRDRNELEKTYEYSRKFSKTGEVVVEEYMSGPEVSVETITIKGVTHIIAITDKETSGHPYFVEMGHSIQSLLSEDMKEDIKKVTKAAITALGIDNSSAHTEIIVTSKGAKVVELGARLGGDNITTSLVPLATGIDMVEACIDLALGNKPNINKRFNKGAAIRYFNSNSGTLSKVEGIEKVRNNEGIQGILISKSIGDKINKIRSSVDRIGYVISQAESTEKAIDICKKTINEIKIIID